MNVIGVDYQRNICLVSLCEGETSLSAVRMVGDGVRALVPLVVHGEDRFGSEAVVARGDEAPQWGSLRPPGPWQEQPEAGRFWRLLFGRLTEHLGRLAPVRQNGYQLALALPVEAGSADAAAVCRLAHAAGFDAVTCFPATEALFSRWLADPWNAPLTGRCTVGVVAVGDTVTQVAAYTVAPGTERLAVLEACPPVAVPIGLAHWADRLLRYVRERRADPVPAASAATVQDTVLEFGMLLGRAGEMQTINWSGPFAEGMYHALGFSRQQVQGWDVVTRFHFALTDALAQVCPGSRGMPDLTLVGGVGATWPCAAAALAGRTQLWQSTLPQQDVACGAALRAAWLPEADAGAAFPFPPEPVEELGERQTWRTSGADRGAGPTPPVPPGPRPPWLPDDEEEDLD